jgi:PPM family protein phosphatase
VSLQLRYAALSDRGLIREGNEDSVYAGPRLLIVADGMGGHAAGEVASAIAVASLAPLDEDAPGADLLDALREATESANDRMQEMVDGDDALDGMGTTLTAMLWAGNRFGVCHIGDSRAYLLRDGELTQITHDHTLVQTLVDEKRITAEEANSHPQRSLLTRALDGREDVDLDLSVREARAGDRYLLCTDGLSGVVSEHTMRESLETPDREAAAQRLVDLALRGGGPDNITLIVADVVDAGDGGDDRIVVGGAAADSPETARLPSHDTAAGRAALAEGRGESRARPVEPVAGEPPRKRRRTGRALLVTGLVVLLLGVAAAAGVAYVRGQYYVGVSATDAGEEVAVFRGVSGSVGGLQLAEVTARPGIRVDDLPAFEQRRVRQGIQADGQSDAEAIVERLWAKVPPEGEQFPTEDGEITPPPAIPPVPGTPAAAPALRVAS